jgi:hypothetical protein
MITMLVPTKNAKMANVNPSQRLAMMLMHAPLIPATKILDVKMWLSFVMTTMNAPKILAIFILDVFSPKSTVTTKILALMILVLVATVSIPQSLATTPTNAPPEFAIQPPEIAFTPLLQLKHQILAPLELAMHSKESLILL